MRRTVCRASAVLVVLAAIMPASNAQAEDAQPAQPSTPAAGAAPAAPAGAAEPAHEDEHEKGRLRIGFNFLNAGLGTGGNLSGPTIGVTFRIGWQLNRLMGVYGNLSPFVWIGSSSTTVAGANVDIGAIGGTQITPLFSLTPADIIELAAGPSADYLTGGSTSAGGVTVGGFSGVYFGVHGKVALHLGGRNEETGRRKGFTIGADIHPVFTPGAATTFITGGLGYDWF